MARVYATVDDLTAWVGEYPPANAATLLARASLDVDAALVGAVYTVDGAGMPTDALVVTALRDAVCAQVDSWWPRDKDGNRCPGGRLVSVQPPPDRSLCPEAVRELRVVGLYPIRAWVRG